MAKADEMKGMVSMMRTAAENKAAQTAVEAGPPPGPDYPYGLAISLGENELVKLGLEDESGKQDLPSVGDEFHLMAVVKVTRVSESASENQPDNCSVDLQITHMQLVAQARPMAKAGAPKTTALAA